jgi:hypothetical protein
VLVVDEAGMVGTRALDELAQAAERARAKLVLVGDDRQLPEIEAGGAFRALADELGASELRDVRRQREAWDRAAEYRDDSTSRLRTIQAERDALAWHHRRRRRELDDLIHYYNNYRDELTDRLQHAREIHHPHDAAEATWLSNHRAATERFLELDAEQRARRQIDHEARQRLERLRHPPDVLSDRALSLDLDTGLDP